jgi:acyl-phosphate glycerol 3-phosphate acyltransferase
LNASFLFAAKGEVIPLIWKCLAILIGSYIVGSLSFSIFTSKALFGGDIRSEGSGNAGATNMARVHGWGAGLLTLAGDALKAAVCMMAGHLLLGDVGLAVGGAGCITGHCFPVFHNFKGGKGIAVGGALSFGIDWRVGVCTVGSFLLVALLSKKVSLGSICGAFAIATSAYLFHVSDPKLLLAVYAACLALCRHGANIKRLIQGTEPDFKAGKGKNGK